MDARRVLVLGGYGGFGAKVSELLARAGFAVVAAGRGLAKAEAFCARHAALGIVPLALDRDGDLAGALAELRPWLVVDAAGPFQGRDYRVAEACIAARRHYLDLADARDFVTGIGALDEAAKAAGVVVISGASSVPALSGAVCDRLAAGLDRVSAIDIALSASNRASGGESVTRAILSYAGRPVRLWRGQSWRTGFGWQEMGKVAFEVPGHTPLKRRVALCEVPDLDLLPARYPGRPATRFRAGTELGLHNVALWLLSWPVRWGWLRGLEGMTGIGVLAQRALRRVGGLRSAMRVELRGRHDGREVRRHWTLLAEQGDGPWVPALAVPLLARRLDAMPPGARDAAGSLTLEEFDEAFAGFAIATAIEKEEAPPLYARIMGEAFARLPPAVRALHLVNGDLAARGVAEVIRGRSWLARAIARLVRFPPSGTTPLSVWMRQAGGCEIWHRDFGGKGLATRMSERGHMVVERFGPIHFAMELRGEADGLSMHIRKWRVAGIPMPLALAPRCAAREREAGGRFHFDVEIGLPFAGPLIHYRGWLTPPSISASPAADSEASPRTAAA